ncbi:hypothetical protein GGS21DRAFT_523846 [Xylaria nigripes]|nr:hypothetical protein GGS21DRAFT_523846 [Xylaria nigripes]
MAESTHPKPKGAGLKVIHASLYRMGTKSMADAYAILGFNVHHGIKVAREQGLKQLKWDVMERAAEATWPGIPGGTSRPPFTRADWDDFWANDYDIITDLAAPFSLELIKAYPEAKVVVVQRDFEPWWISFSRDIVERVYRPDYVVISWITSTFLGVRMIQGMRKVLYGFLNVRSKNEMTKEVSKVAYEKFFKDIRELVPPERRLEFKLTDGWEPLCSFLEVDAPQDVPFPRQNDSASLDADMRSVHGGYMSQTIQVVWSSPIARIIVGGACGWLAYRQYVA